MTKTTVWTARLLMLTLALMLCGVPPMAQAQTASPPTSAPTANTSQNDTNGQPGIVDPSKGPLQPVPPAESLPEAPSALPQQPSTPGTPPSPPAQQTQPEGAAVGQQGATSGGPASRPAGTAIAPAKQRQYRSLFLKIGALAAAGVAIGTVVALTKGSPTNPPGAR